MNKSNHWLIIIVDKDVALQMWTVSTCLNSGPQPSVDLTLIMVPWAHTTPCCMLQPLYISEPRTLVSALHLQLLFQSYIFGCPGIMDFVAARAVWLDGVALHAITSGLEQVSGVRKTRCFHRPLGMMSTDGYDGMHILEFDMCVCTAATGH